MNTHDISTLKTALSAPDVLERVRQWLLEQAGRTLLQFAYFLCVSLSLRNPDGRYRDHTCARALEELHRDGLLDLQGSLRWEPPREKRSHKPRCLPEPVPLPKGVPDSVEKIGKIWGLSAFVGGGPAGPVSASPPAVRFRGGERLRMKP